MRGPARAGARPGALAAGVALALAGCADAPPTMPAPPARLDLVAYGEGAALPGFAFLPPVGPPATRDAPSDVSIAEHVVVEICRWRGTECAGPAVARFTLGSDPDPQALRLDAGDGAYLALWHVEPSPSGEDEYRIRVLVAGTELGHRTVTMGPPAGPDGEEDTTAVPGPTVPVRFRIEPGAVHVVGPEGGAVIHEGGALRLDVPPGALARAVGFTVGAADAPPDPTLVPGTVYGLGPDSVRFASPAELSLAYDPARVPSGVDEPMLRVHRVLAGSLAEVRGNADPQADRASGRADGTGTYAVAAMRPVHSVAVDPAVLELPVGQALQLRAQALDARGRPLERPLTWESSAPAAAAVDGTGLVTAAASGVTLVRVTVGGAVGESRVTVTNPAFPREPAGFTQITSRPFDAVEELGWDTALEIARNFEIVADASAPLSPPNVGRAAFPRDSIGGREFGTVSLIRFEEPRYRRLYVSCWVKLSDNWQGHRSTVNKILYVSADGHISSPVFMTAHGADDGPLYPQVWLQNTPVGARNLGGNVGADVVMHRGRWHHWELLLEMNTGGDANGEAHWWLDGIKVGEHRDVVFAHAWEGHVWDQVKWSPVWGGVEDVIEEDMHQSLDHIYVSGGR